jgi:divalent metal cation (Fe/Co/Zn/Cd) transporter
MATPLTLGASPSRRDQLARRIRMLVAATITWNLAEAAVALASGTSASSTALVGFGLDSLIEVASAAALAWQFSAADHAARQARERTALRLIAVSFYALAGYLTADSIHTLIGTGSQARPSVPGIALAAASLIVMPLLSTAQRRTGCELGSATAVADSKQALLCTYLSAVLLIGLLANALFGWSWADPAAALAIAAVAAREGRQAWRGDACCAAPTAATGPSALADACGCGPGCACAD